MPWCAAMRPPALASTAGVGEDPVQLRAEQAPGSWMDHLVCPQEERGRASQVRARLGHACMERMGSANTAGYEDAPMHLRMYIINGLLALGSAKGTRCGVRLHACVCVCVCGGGGGSFLLLHCI